MSPVRVTFRRTIGMIAGLYVSSLAIAGFFAAASALFVFNLDSSEGGFSNLASIWTVSVSPVLPALAALLAMEVWSDERKTGRIEILLSSPVREREFVIGKFLGVWGLTLISVAVFLGATLFFLKSYAPRLLSDSSCGGFVLGFFILSIQSALWSAVSVALSTFFRNAAGAAAVSILVLIALPRATWLALSHWIRDGRLRFGELPMDAHAFDFASGLVSVGIVLSYLLLSLFALFVASKVIALLRYAGKSASLARLSARVSILLAAIFSLLAVALSCRVDLTLDLPVAGSGETRFSAQTRDILAGSQGSITITSFVARKDPRFRHVSHFLRSLKREADEMGGVRLEIKYVDPVLDMGEALRLVRAGVEKSSIVFERDGRIAHTLNINDGYGERLCASFIERIAVPFQRSCVYWTSGHGEAAFDDYSSEGLSDIARDLSLNGYDNKKINLADPTSSIGADCALIIVAGPRTDFSIKELERLSAYLDGLSQKNEGGRLLVLSGSSELRGIANLLSEWGIRLGAGEIGESGTISGTDVIVSEFLDSHSITRPFAGQQVVLEKPLTFARTSSAIEGESAVDRKRYSELLTAGGRCVAAAVERGSMSSDLAIRPTRVMAVGDIGFVMNGKLRSYANANRDFFLNSVKFLSGRDAMTSPGVESGRLVLGMDRKSRSALAIYASVVFPISFFVLYAIVLAGRRRKR